MIIYVIGIRGMPSVEGGIEKHAKELYSRIALDPKYDIYIFTIKDYQKLKTWKNINFIKLPALPLSSLEKISYAFVATIYTIFKRPDIVHIQGLNSALYIPLLRLFGIKVVYTQHSRDYLYPKWGFLGKRILKFSEYCAQYSHVIIGISKEISEIFKIRRHAQVYTIGNGTEVFNKTKEFTSNVLKVFNIEEKKYILFVGRFTPEKSIEDLIDAYVQLNTDKFKLVIVGSYSKDDPYTSFILNKTSKNKNIVLTGFLTGEDLSSIYHFAKLFVLPSKFEGLPIVALEAISYQTEVLLSNIQANVELKLKNNNYFQQGSIEDLTNKMSVVLDNKVNLLRLESIAKDIEDRYNWNKISEQIKSIYVELNQ